MKVDSLTHGDYSAPAVRQRDASSSDLLRAGCSSGVDAGPQAPRNSLTRAAMSRWSCGLPTALRLERADDNSASDGTLSKEPQALHIY